MFRWLTCWLKLLKFDTTELKGKMQPTKCRYQILYPVSKIVKHNFASTEMPKYYAAPNYFQCSMQSLNVNNLNMPPLKKQDNIE